MKTMIKEYPEVVKQIHKEYFTAGDKLLAAANEIIGSHPSGLFEKANKLKSVGFTAVPETQVHRELEFSIDMANLISNYAIRYPNNKFITEDQVKSINKKYKLVCAPLDRFKGFVPQTKLDQILSFSVRSKDKAPNLIRIIRAWGEYNNKGLPFLFTPISALIIHADVGRFISSDDPGLHWHGSRLFQYKEAYITSYKMYDKSSMLICAPKKDMNLKGLSKAGAVFHKVVKHTAPPDPVVLQPVKGGYLIVAAWGDEASDDIVVNHNSN